MSGSIVFDVRQKLWKVGLISIDDHAPNRSLTKELIGCAAEFLEEHMGPSDLPGFDGHDCSLVPIRAQARQADHPARKEQQPVDPEERNDRAGQEHISPHSVTNGQIEAPGFLRGLDRRHAVRVAA